MVHRSIVPIGTGTAMFFLLVTSARTWTQQPPEPIDPTPQDGEVYALMDQATGLQLTGNPSGFGGSNVSLVLGRA